MKKTASEIVTAVRVCMDEIGLNDAAFMGGEDNTALDTIIKSKIVDALRYVHGNADTDMLTPDAEEEVACTPETDAGTSAAATDTEESATDGLTGVINAKKKVSIVLPTGLMRLCYVKLQEWVMALSDYILWTDKEYAKLQDVHSTGTWERPRMALALKKDKRRVLELYSAKGIEKTTCFVGYMEEPAEGDDGYNISDKLYVAFIYYVSGLVLLTLKDEHADSMFNQALTLMGISPQGGDAQ